MKCRRMRVTPILLLILAALDCGSLRGAERTVRGYVLDSACAFVKNLKKPISADCAVACAKAGSPLVILADDGTIYWPISEATPAASQNDRLLPFAGQKVSATGKVFTKGGSRALVIEKVEAASRGK
jgi:hypothetical protein